MSRARIDVENAIVANENARLWVINAHNRRMDMRKHTQERIRQRKAQMAAEAEEWMAREARKEEQAAAARQRRVEKDRRFRIAMFESNKMHREFMSKLNNEYILLYFIITRKHRKVKDAKAHGKGTRLASGIDGRSTEDGGRGFVGGEYEQNRILPRVQPANKEFEEKVVAHNEVFDKLIEAANESLS